MLVVTKRCGSEGSSEAPLTWRDVAGLCVESSGKLGHRAQNAHTEVRDKRSTALLALDEVCIESRVMKKGVIDRLVDLFSVCRLSWSRKYECLHDFASDGSKAMSASDLWHGKPLLVWRNYISSLVAWDKHRVTCIIKQDNPWGSELSNKLTASSFWLQNSNLACAFASDICDKDEKHK